MPANEKPGPELNIGPWRYLLWIMALFGMLYLFYSQGLPTAVSQPESQPFLPVVVGLSIIDLPINLLNASLASSGLLMATKPAGQGNYEAAEELFDSPLHESIIFNIA